MNRIVSAAISTAFVFALSSVAVVTQAAEKGSKSSSSWPTFKKADADSSGAVSQDEAKSITGLESNFSQYDKNGDGQLSQSEYEAAKKAASKSGSSSSSKSGGSSSSMGSSGSSGSMGNSGAATGGGAGSSSGSR